MSTTTKLVLDVLLSTDRAYGLEICRRAGLATGTVHPILARLERAAWVTSEWEDLDPHQAGRPARRFYTLTPGGAQRAVQALAVAPLARPPGVPAPGLG